MKQNIEAYLRELNLQEKNVIALACCRELVPVLYEREQYVIAKLIEIPIELCLEFYKKKSKVFNRVYGCIDPLLFREQEQLSEAGLTDCLHASVEIILSSCIDIHQHHINVDGGSGPSYDCYLADVGGDAPLNSLQYTANAFSTLEFRNSFDFEIWLTESVSQIKETSIELWVNSLPALDVTYPFGQPNA